MVTVYKLINFFQMNMFLNTFIIISIILFGCKNDVKNKENSFTSREIFKIEDIKSNFRYQKQISFYNKDSIQNFMKLIMNKQEKPVLNELYRKVFPNDKEIDTMLTEYSKYLYNIQNFENPLSYTIFSTNDDWVSQIELVVVTKDNSLLQREILAEYGGDQDYFIETSSLFLNKNKFVRTKKIFKYDLTLDDNVLYKQFIDTVIIK
jgi:hypothetical protein